MFICIAAVLLLEYKSTCSSIKHVLYTCIGTQRSGFLVPICCELISTCLWRLVGMLREVGPRGIRLNGEACKEFLSKTFFLGVRHVISRNKNFWTT